jgi:hypothetical protein
VTSTNTLTGHECESTWNCAKVNILWDESVSISPNVGIYCGCDYLCDHSNELFKQGNAHLRRKKIHFFLYHLLLISFELMDAVFFCHVFCLSGALVICVNFVYVWLTMIKGGCHHY